nr:MAG: hypothetical protein [Hangzhou sobemo-like virus 1]
MRICITLSMLARSMVWGIGEISDQSVSGWTLSLIEVAEAIDAWVEGVVLELTLRLTWARFCASLVSIYLGAIAVAILVATVIWFIGFVVRIVRSIHSAARKVGRGVSQAPSILTFVWWPVYAPVRWALASIYTSRVSVKYAVESYSADENRAVSQKEMANVLCPSSPAKWPPYLVSVVNDHMCHVGFATAVRVDGVAYIVTAAHVVSAARVGDGQVRLVNGSGTCYVLNGDNTRVVRGSKAFDQMHLKVPANLFSMLQLRAIKAAFPDSSMPITVFSPGTVVQSSTSIFSTPRGGKLVYAASTIPGSSGSPLIQNGHIVGVHVRGTKTAGGSVLNSGFGVLGFVDTVSDEETSSKAAQYAWLVEREDDFAAEEGYEEVDDFLDLPGHKRSSRLLFSGPHRLVVSLRDAKPVPKAAWTSISGTYWADDLDEDWEQGNAKPPVKTHLEALTGQPQLQPEKSAKPSCGDAGRKKRRRRQRKASSPTVESPASARAPSPEASESSQTRLESSRPSPSGQRPIEAPKLSAAALSTKPTTDFKAKSQMHLQDSRKRLIATLRQQLSRLEGQE